jgi:hypothetical protein
LKSLFLEKPFSFYQILFFKPWLKNLSPHLSLTANPGPPVGLGPPVGPAYWSNPTSGSIGPTVRLFPLAHSHPLLSRDPPGDCVITPPPCSIPMSSVGLRRRDAAQSIDQATAVPPVREIYSIASSLPASPFASEARDSGHGDLELALELLGLVHGGAWAW